MLALISYTFSSLLTNLWHYLLVKIEACLTKTFSDTQSVASTPLKILIHLEDSTSNRQVHNASLQNFILLKVPTILFLHSLAGVISTCGYSGHSIFVNLKVKTEECARRTARNVLLKRTVGRDGSSYLSEFCTSLITCVTSSITVDWVNGEHPTQ